MLKRTLTGLMTAVAPFFDGRAPRVAALANPPQVCATVLLIDGSTSMESDDWQPTRMAAARRGAREYAALRETHSPEDRIAVVCFSSDAQVHCPLLELRTQSAAVRKAVDSTGTGGSTSIGAGLQAAERLLLGTEPRWWARLVGPSCATDQVPSGVLKRIIILSDGGQNTKPRPEPIAARLKAAGVVIDCVGIGLQKEVDEDLLRRLASTPQRYRFIGDAQELFEHYRKLATSLTL
ncbi:MAG: hypothetical protein FLDDKLPJ_03746 [Phycisphaerae bacterium]|nr:hypothetical protein [Phycisphaerae bacterium]